MIDTYLDYNQPPPSLITKWRSRATRTQLEFTLHCSWSGVHGVNGTLFHRSWTRNHQFTSAKEPSISTGRWHVGKHSI